MGFCFGFEAVEASALCGLATDKASVVVVFEGFELLDDFLLQFCLVILEASALFYDFFEEDVVPVLGEYLVDQVLVLVLGKFGLLIFLFVKIALYDFAVFLPEPAFIFLVLGGIERVEVKHFFLLLGVAGLENQWDLHSAELVEGQFDFAGR